MSKTHPISTDPRFIDLTGQKFGRLFVISYAGRGKGSSMWNVVCDCGATKQVGGRVLRIGGTKSCGCLCKEVCGKHLLTHGEAAYPRRTSEYRTWLAMKERCRSPRCRQYKNYGERGITVCERWQTSFPAFIEDMGRRPHPDYELERMDNDGPYCKENCIWVPMPAQARNRRNNHLITFRGKTQCLAEWAEELGIASPTIRRRLRRGWSANKALSTPV